MLKPSSTAYNQATRQKCTLVHLRILYASAVWPFKRSALRHSRKADQASNLRLARDHHTTMARAPTEQGIHGAQDSEMIRHHQNSQPTYNRKQDPFMTQQVVEDRVTSNH